MKNTIIVVMLATICNLFADDIIFKKNSEKISCTVIAITSDQIRYYKETDLQYPIYSIQKSFVSYIKFESGEKIVITKKNISKPIPVPKRNIEKFKQIQKKIANAPQVQKAPQVQNIPKVKTEKPKQKTTINKPKKKPVVTKKPVEKKPEKKVAKDPIKRRRYAIFLGGGSIKTLFEKDIVSLVTTLSIVGIQREFPLASFFSLKSGILLSFRRGNYDDITTVSTTPTYSYTLKEVEVRVLDLEFPLLINLGLNLGKSKKIRIYTDFGVRLSIDLLRDYYAFYSGTASTNNTDNELEMMNYGVIIAIGTEISNRFIVEVKYDFDITNRYKTDDKCTFESTLLMLGYKF